jgi:2-dehydro-3-deoxygalactonokinase
MSRRAEPDLLGIDWGTSNRRAWWLDRDGGVLAEHGDDQGLLACQGRFEEAYRALLRAGPPIGPDAPVLMSGMVGAASGWVEAPYMDAGVPLAALAQHLQPVPAAGPRCFIVPGVCFAADDGSVDVMRGEETQLLGALALGHGDGWYLLPGTHSKWVRLHGGRVADLATYMTGELFALLTQHGTLSSVTQQQALPDAADHARAFERGIAAASRTALSNALFGCRAQVVAGRMPAGDARDYLSGLLIGAEWHDVRRRAGRTPGQVTLIGSAALAQRHAQAAEANGCRLTPLDARAVHLAALRSLRTHL